MALAICANPCAEPSAAGRVAADGAQPLAEGAALAMLLRNGVGSDEMGGQACWPAGCFASAARIAYNEGNG